MAGNHMSELSPRQRMINMMYLVLTALLALNVSKEVLEAFAKMDNSIEYAYGDKYSSNEKHYLDFKNRAEKNPEKFQEWYSHALNVKRESKEILDSIQSVKTKIELLAGGYDKDGMLVKKDDKDLVKKLLVKDLSEKGAYGYGAMLVKARDKYRNFLLSLDSLNIYIGNDVKVKDRINQILSTEDFDEDGSGPKAAVSWQDAQYNGHVPIAVMAFMAQMKLDVGSLEGEILELLQKKIGQSSITVNSQIGVVKAPKQTIMLGDSFKARVFIAGVDTNQLPTFSLHKYDSKGNRIESVPYDTLINDGSEGLYSTKPTRQGTYYFGGDIIIQSEEGEKTYPFLQEYRVDAPLSVISPDKMNVIYTEVINPLSISVPGYSSDELQLYSDFSGCKIKSIKNGSYEAVIAKKQKGKNRKKTMNLFIKDKSSGKIVGEKITFRIKNVPPPKPSIKKILGTGEMTPQELGTAAGIRAKLENFDFELSFEITSFRYTYPTNTGAFKTQSYSGWKFTPDLKSQFNGLKPGQKIIFDGFEYKIKGSKEKPSKMYESLVITIL
tara:strand:+ start:2111 stop:3766 length:1656 start_codon:yes stop_codon:yes gene_type:complete